MTASGPKQTNEPVFADVRLGPAGDILGRRAGRVLGRGRRHAEKSTSDIRSELGVGDTRHVLANGTLVTLRGRAALVHDYNPGSRVQAAFQTPPGTSFVVDGAAARRGAGGAAVHQRRDTDRQIRRRVLRPLAHARRHRDAEIRMVTRMIQY